MNEKIHSYFSIIQKITKQRHIEVFLVGGALRDRLLDRETYDYDFAVQRNAISFAKRFAQNIQGAFVLLDQEHGSARVVKKQQGQMFTFDFSDFRAESLRKDVRCRDFTINTFAVDMALWDGASLDAHIVDYLGGRKDLNKRVIRMVSAKAFEQDPLRLLRAFALRAVLGFSIEKTTLLRIKKDSLLIRSVSAERIRDELFKIFESCRSGQVLKEMNRAGLLELVIPQVRVMFGVEQGTYHHLDVWMHALETVQQIDMLIDHYDHDQDMMSYLDQRIAGHRSRKALLKLACVLHDVGKPQTRVRQGERICFHGHEHAGRALSAAVAKQLKLSRRERHILGDMVQFHLRPGYLSNLKRPSAKAMFRYFRDTGTEAASIALLARADQRATRGPMTTEAEAAHHDAVCLGVIDLFFQQQKQQPIIPLINGHDLIQRLGLQPSPLFSKILKEVQEAQATGKVNTVKQALAMAGKIAAMALPGFLPKENNDDL